MYQHELLSWQLSVGIVKHTAPVCPFTLETASVGVFSSFQLVAVLYGLSAKIYVLLSAVDIAISHFSAVVNHVKQLQLATVNVSVIAKAGNIVVHSFQLLSSTGIVQLVVPVFLLAAVHSVGVPVKSQYLPVVAIVHKSQVLAYGVKSELVKVPVQVVYPQLFHSWQLSVGIVGVL